MKIKKKVKNLLKSLKIEGFHSENVILNDL